MTADEQRVIDLDDLERKMRGRSACPDLDQQWPGIDGNPRGPVLCVSYPDCRCGYEDRRIAVAANSPPVTRAMIARIRELESACRCAAQALRIHDPSSPTAMHVDGIIEKGPLLP